MSKHEVPHRCAALWPINEMKTSLVFKNVEIFWQALNSDCNEAQIIGFAVRRC